MVADASPLVEQDGLAARGFTVTRLNTYNTVAVTTVDSDSLELAKRARVVAIASPSAVKCGLLQPCCHVGVDFRPCRWAALACVQALLGRRAWVQLVGEATAQRIAVAGIGSTSGKAAQNMGLREVSWPDDPGVSGFLDCILRTLASSRTPA